jgi:hypothetical protein
MVHYKVTLTVAEREQLKAIKGKAKHTPQHSAMLVFCFIVMFETVRHVIKKRNKTLEIKGSLI